MNDNALFAIVRQVLIDAFAAVDVPLAGGVVQANQTERHGVASNATLYFYKLGSRRVGGPQVTQAYDEDADNFDESTLTQYATNLQFEAWVPQTDDADEKTAADYVELAADILQAPATIEALRAQGVGIERVTDIRNPYFVDDRDQNSASPSFDVTFTHKRGVTLKAPAVQYIEAGHYPV